MWWRRLPVDSTHFSVMSSFILKLPFTCDDYCERAFLRERAYVPTSSYVHWQACSTYVHFSTRVCVATCILVRGWRHLFFSFLTVGTKVNLIVCVYFDHRRSPHIGLVALPSPSPRWLSVVWYRGDGLQCLLVFPDPGTAWSSANWVLFLLLQTRQNSQALLTSSTRSSTDSSIVPKSLDLLTLWVDHKKRGPWALQGATRPILADFLSVYKWGYWQLQMRYWQNRSRKYLYILRWMFEYCTLKWFCFCESL